MSRKVVPVLALALARLLPESGVGLVLLRPRRTPTEMKIS
jgi:hypothetical protein